MPFTAKLPCLQKQEPRHGQLVKKFCNNHGSSGLAGSDGRLLIDGLNVNSLVTLVVFLVCYTFTQLSFYLDRLKSCDRRTYVPSHFFLDAQLSSFLRRQGSRSCTSSARARTAISDRTVLLEFEIVLLDSCFRRNDGWAQE